MPTVGRNTGPVATTPARNNKQLGEDVSHGCVRHSNEDILKLYDALSVGDHVAIVSGLKDARLRH